jgi:heme a synthase
VWLKRLGIWAVVLVVLQGILGGLTVKYFLKLSILHGVLAQTFFLVTLLLAYGLSVERGMRLNQQSTHDRGFLRMAVLLLGLVYVQLILGNWMRHSNAGLAIPDFPTAGGTLIPTMDQAMLDRINAWRFEHNLDFVRMGQVHIHLLHRIWAFIVLTSLLAVNYSAFNRCLGKPLILKSLLLLNMVLAIQVMLGIGTVLFQKEVVTTTLHVTVGAVVLGLSFLLVMRASPLQWQAFKESVGQSK